MNSAQLIEVNKAIDVCLVKIGQKPRAMRNYQRLKRQGERKLLPRIKEWINEMIKEVQAGLPKMKGKTATQRTKSIADWDEIKANGLVILKPTMLELLGEGGKMVVERKILKQERFDVIGLEAVTWATEHTATLVTEITEETMKAIQSYIAKGIDAGKSVQKIARELRPLVGLTEKQIFAVANFHEKLILDRPEWTAARQRSSAEAYARRLHRKRAVTIARTETAFALTEGQREGYSQMGVTHLERVEDPATEDDECADNNGRIYTLAEAQGVLPAHPNCLLGDSLVLPCGDISGASKRWYEGEIIIFKTSSGRKLSCTPHHPILTELGFCSADSLNVGSNVVSNGLSQRERFVDWYNINKPSVIKKIADSFFKSGSVTANRVPTSPMDFHGDGVGSKVAVVGSNRFLVRGFNPTFTKHFLKLNLIARKIGRIILNRLGMLAFSIPSYFHSFSCSMSRFNLKLALIFRHLFPNNFDSLRLASDLDITLNQSSMNSSPTYVERFRNFNFRVTKIIETINPINRKIVLYEFPESISFPWFFDNIIHKKISNYKGYVYNLETTKSYYIANGIAIHNCEGTWVAA